MSLSSVWSMLSEFFLKVGDSFRHFGIVDVFDIALVTVLIYVVIKHLRGSQSIQMIKGVIVVGVLYGAVNLLGMDASKFLFNKLLGNIIVIFAIIFAPELRRGLEGLGKGHWTKRFFSSSLSDEEENVISSITSAAKHMADKKVGSLIIIQRSSLLGDLTHSNNAKILDAQVSETLLCSIFYPKAPLHDGAVVIHNGRIVAASCVVPLRNKSEAPANVGTRHRAAIEVSRYSDAVVVVTSEERGEISVAIGGELIQNISEGQLSGILLEALDRSTPDKGGKMNVTRKFTEKAPVRTPSKPAKAARKDKKPPETENKGVTIDDIVLPGEEEPKEEVQAAEEAPASVEAPSKQELPSIINEGEISDEQE